MKDLNATTTKEMEKKLEQLYADFPTIDQLIIKTMYYIGYSDGLGKAQEVFKDD